MKPWCHGMNLCEAELVVIVLGHCLMKVKVWQMTLEHCPMKAKAGQVIDDDEPTLESKMGLRSNN